jgi:TnpA family transposase
LLKRSVYVSPSYKWGDLRDALLGDEEWKTLRPQVCRSLGRSQSAQPELERLKQDLDTAYRLTAAGIPTNEALRIEKIDGRDSLILTPLDELPETESLKQLRQAVYALLPRVGMPELVLEMVQRTGIAQAFVTPGQEQARVSDFPLSLCAALLADAMNVGIQPFVRSDIPALRRGRLNWIQQTYLRLDTLTPANAPLVEAQTHIPLAQAWGGGEVATADGLRFVVPVRTVAAGPNSRYFGPGNGVTYYNFASNQGTGLHGLVITGTLRDAPYLIQGLLSQESTLQPTEVITDTAGYSDVVFGLLWLLGRLFSPRLADIGEARFWRIDRRADYGPLDDLARHRISLKRIESQWDDMLRATGSLILGHVSPVDLIRSLHHSGQSSALGQAIGELGRIAKTLFLLAYIDDEAYRRRILTALSRHEGRHSLARAIFHGKRGELHQRYREGQEDQLGALGLVVNLVVLWNTLYMNAALDHLRATGFDVRDEDVQRLAPFGFEHINFLGTYDFSLPEEVQQGQLRPFHNPHDPDNIY